jgi:hypothetical protein
MGGLSLAVFGQRTDVAIANEIKSIDDCALAIPFSPKIMQSGFSLSNSRA